jgi:hypothetical protein
LDRVHNTHAHYIPCFPQGQIRHQSAKLCHSLLGAEPLPTLTPIPLAVLGCSTPLPTSCCRLESYTADVCGSQLLSNCPPIPGGGLILLTPWPSGGEGFEPTTVELLSDGLIEPRPTETGRDPRPTEGGGAEPAPSPADKCPTEPGDAKPRPTLTAGPGQGGCQEGGAHSGLAALAKGGVGRLEGGNMPLPTPVISGW